MEINNSSLRKAYLNKAPCALDLGDGSERGLYVNQDYILRKLHKIHRGISLMYTYYPNDETWPVRASIACPQKSPTGAWDYPYEDYFPYRGGKEGLRDEEPFNFMKEIRRHGQDVVLTLTIDPALTDEELIPLAEDLRPYGRIFLRLNHECTGSWFAYTRRSPSYQHLADLYVRACKIFHKHAPNVKMILCAGMYDKSTGKIEMEDEFLEAFKETDYWSGDNYLSLHFGWPCDVATKETKNYVCYDVDEIYEKAKMTKKRLIEITGMEKPMLLSELNADGDVSGAYGQAEMMDKFMNRLEADEEKWLDGFTLYQFRDDGRLGLEITDPNNSDVGIEQPLLSSYRTQLHKQFFSQQIVTGEQIKLPAQLRWGSSEDSEGIEIELELKENPVFAEIYFNDKLIPLNLMLEMNGYWYYKAPGVKFVDLMSYFYINKIENGQKIKLRFFAPPADGMNKNENGNPYDLNDGDWMNNVYTVLPELPEIRIEYEPVLKI